MIVFKRIVRSFRIVEEDSPIVIILTVSEDSGDNPSHCYKSRLPANKPLRMFQGHNIMGYDKPSGLFQKAVAL